MAHLDIKPDNYVFTANNQLVYIDLGHAHECSEAINSRTGTDRYLAPEVQRACLTESFYDPCQVDIFNIGMMFFIILF